uniref:Lactate/malate dehydrogenase C-terminal domain-containing protein n=1 Tax=Panagrolaimus davidi TaxID=227884 RepID=A0A914PYY9_9BILA
MINNAGIARDLAEAAAEINKNNGVYDPQRILESPHWMLSVLKHSSLNLRKLFYVQSDVVKDVDYFSTPLELGPNGVEKVLGYGKLSSYEKSLVEAAVPELQKNIAKGVKFIKG